MIIRSDEFQDVEVPGSGAMRMHLFRPAVDGRFPASSCSPKSIR
ncbi:hypothetical protein P0F65_18445 [Sphingomonas sp. I4]